MVTENEKKMMLKTYLKDNNRALNTPLPKDF